MIIVSAFEQHNQTCTCHCPLCLFLLSLPPKGVYVLTKCALDLLYEALQTDFVPCLCLQVYSVQDSLLCLTGTAEIPLGAIYMDQILNEDQLPIKMAGFGHCFRTEAGAGGDLTHLSSYMAIVSGK